MTEDESAVLLRQYIQQALVTKAASGSTQLYDQLLDEVRKLRGAVHAAGASAGAAPESAVPQQLVLLLTGLGQNASHLHERKHELLVAAVLDTPLWHVPRAVRLAALELVTHLVVANGGLVQACLQALVYSLLPPPGPPTPDAAAGRPWAPDPEEAATQDEVLRLVPTAGSRILPPLVAGLPHKLRARPTQCLYLRGLFTLAESPAGTAVREGVLAAVVDHLISVDVDVRWEDIVDEVTEETKEEEGGDPPQDDGDIFELEGLSELELNGYAPEPDPLRGGWEGGRARRAPGAAGGAAPESQAARDAKDTVDKLDSMMELTFAHLQRRVGAGQLAQAWATLLAAFERSVLHTHRSKFAQFLLFFLCRAAPVECSRGFLDLLFARLTDRQQPPITRAAASYVPEPLVVDSLRRLADWCLKYARDDDRRGGLATIPSAGSMTAMLSADAAVRHGAFYAACQALLYVLCYHLEPLLAPAAQAHVAPAHAADGQQDGQQQQQNGQQEQQGVAPARRHGHHGHHHGGHAEEARAACAAAVRALFADVMPALLTHRLDPLGSIARSVVAEFARQARRVGFADLARRIRERERAQAARGARQASARDAGRRGEGGAPRRACRRALSPRAAAGDCAPLLSPLADVAPSPSLLPMFPPPLRTAPLQSRQLEMFFPFDPYLLARSAAYLDLATSFVQWRRGHPAGAIRAAVEGSDAGSGSDSESGSDAGSDVGSDSEAEGMSEEEDGRAGGAVAADGRVRLSGGSPSGSSSSGLSSGDDSDSSASSSGDDSDSEEEEDLKRTRFGSVPGSFGSDRRPSKRRLALPLALQASLLHGGGSSPTQGFLVGSGSPFGTSPYGAGSPWGAGGAGIGAGAPLAPQPFGAAAAPAPLPMGRASVAPRKP
eukprot:scaffold12.g8082.t1